MKTYPEYLADAYRLKMQFAEKLAAEYRSGLTVHAVALKNRMHPRQAHRLLAMVSLELRPPGNPRKQVGKVGTDAV